MDRARGRGAASFASATRTMCVGAYVDMALRDSAIKRVYNDRSRIVAPSFGFDLIPVLIHARRALLIELVEMALVTVALCAAFCLDPFAVLGALAVLGSWAALSSAAELLREWIEYLRERKSYNELEQIRIRVKILAFTILGCSLALILAFIVIMRFDVHRTFGPHLWLTVQGLWGAVALVAGIGGCVALFASARQCIVVRLPRDSSFRLAPSNRRLQTIDDQQRKPYTVYAGYKPFIGSGQEIVAWSFAQRLVPVETTPIGGGRVSTVEFDNPPFSCTELVDKLREAIESLTTETHPETRLPGLTVSDHILIAGTHIGPYRESLDGDAVAAVTSLIGEPRDTARHHLACQVVSWGGEIVTTVFVHTSLQGRTLYLEFSAYALLPMPHEYHAVDEVGGDGFSAVVRSAISSVLTLPHVLLAPKRLSHGLVLALASIRARKDTTKSPRRGVNIGTLFSLRERAADHDGELYFQLRDISKHLKIIERRLLATVEGFLTAAGVDTSEFVQRATTILNNGVINAGSGEVNFTNSAVGDRARVVQHPSAPVTTPAQSGS